MSAATKSEATVKFSPLSAELSIDDTVSDISKSNNLYYLNSVKLQDMAKHDIKMWHNILGH